MKDFSGFVSVCKEYEKLLSDAKSTQQNLQKAYEDLHAILVILQDWHHANRGKEVKDATFLRDLDQRFQQVQPLWEEFEHLLNRIKQDYEALRKEFDDMT